MTLTHFGYRSGWVARIYGVIYAVLLVALLLEIWRATQSLKGLTLPELRRSLTFSIGPQPWTGVVFAGMALILGLVFFLFWTYLRRKRNIAPDRQEIAHRLAARSYSIPTVLLIISGILAIGAPMSVLYLLLVGYSYYEMAGEWKMLQLAEARSASSPAAAA